ncbi:MAG TPA: DUF3761 domain-containing protein [Terriglobales bacterium]|nr:DUF3761 domain-containing protein [Terriglobales bacterium]
MKRSALAIIASLAFSLSAFAGGSHGSTHHGPATHAYQHPRATHTHHSYYTNSSGHRVHTPVHALSSPPRATARCRDGSYSFSEHHRGTCSRHGGVSSWLTH